MDTIAKIETTIRQISQLYREFTEDYYGHTEWEPINLRKLTVGEALEKPVFSPYIKDYLQTIKQYSRDKADFSLGFPENILRWRRKSMTTIRQKLLAKHKMEVLTGSFSIQKVLNDLMGYRLILPGVIENQLELAEMLDRIKAETLLSRWYVRNDHHYHAVHCYFRLNNRCFSWELQIWDVADAKNNIKDHKYHEQQRQQQLK